MNHESHHCLAFLAGVALTWLALTLVHRSDQAVAGRILLSPTPVRVAPTPTPAPTWMYHRRTALDEPPRPVGRRRDQW